MQARALVEEVFVRSPLARHLGIEERLIEIDHVRLALPFAGHNVTVGTMVHGGAIAALIDTAAAACCWATDDLPDPPRGSTVGFSVNYLAAAEQCELVADARIVRRGGSIVICDVWVTDESETAIARATVTYMMPRTRRSA